jgi:hypothetical protein
MLAAARKAILGFVVAPRTLTVLGCVAAAAAGFLLEFAYLKSDERPVAPQEFTFEFSKGAPDTRFLISGWSLPEDWGTWSTAETAELDVALASLPLGVVSATVQARAFVAGGETSSQRVSVVVNGTPVTTLTYSAVEPERGWTFDIPRPVAAKRNPIRLTLHIARPQSPLETGAGPDDRKLGIGLKWIKLRYAPSVIVDR